MLYNTDFKVKYFDIKEELINNLITDLNYTKNDIICVCDKLYRDELSSVFYTDNIFDDKIDIGMKHIRQLMMQNSEFNAMIEEISMYSFVCKLLQMATPNPNPNLKENAHDILFLILFSEELFYLMHLCICQYITTTVIESILLITLKEKIIHIIQNVI
jgi:hypothetical protein